MRVKLTSMAEANQIQIIFEKYIARQCSPSEFNELLAWITTISEAESDNLEKPMKLLWEEAKAGRLPSSADLVDWDRMYEKLIHHQENAAVISLKTSHIGRFTWWRIAAASVIIFVAMGSLLYLFTKNQKQEHIMAEPGVYRSPSEVMPGMQKAILTLANGHKIELDSVGKGVVASQGGVSIIKSEETILTYAKPDKDQINALPVFNIISTPRGAQYQVILSDGSRVWLNAASSLRFPTLFSGKTRNVELAGEGYFEVAHNADHPFHVSVRGMDVEVKGTHFNIMAYQDESTIQSSLLEGSIAVTVSSKTFMVKPGEQASFNPASGNLQIKNANMNQAVAWKNGYFYFDKADVPAILRQVSRWYDLDIEYQSAAPSDMFFSGKIQRNLPLTGIAHLLENGPIHFRIEGKKLIVVK